MKIAELITLAENKLTTLNQALATAQARGDIDCLCEIDSRIVETQNTLDTLRQIGD